MVASPWEHASRKGLPSSFSKRAEETQEEAPDAEPWFLLQEYEMPGML